MSVGLQLSESVTGGWRFHGQNGSFMCWAGSERVVAQHWAQACGAGFPAKARLSTLDVLFQGGP